MNSTSTGRDHWPDGEEFRRHGRARLLQQVTLDRGEHWWTLKLGLPFQTPPNTGQAWDDERVRATLELYLTGKTHWPPRREFKLDRMHALRNAIDQTGGVLRWADEIPDAPKPRKGTRR